MVDNFYLYAIRYWYDFKKNYILKLCRFDFSTTYTMGLLKKLFGPFTDWELVLKYYAGFNRHIHSLSERHFDFLMIKAKRQLLKTNLKDNAKDCINNVMETLFKIKKEERSSKFKPVEGRERDALGIRVKNKAIDMYRKWHTEQKELKLFTYTAKNNNSPFIDNDEFTFIMEDDKLKTQAENALNEDELLVFKLNQSRQEIADILNKKREGKKLKESDIKAIRQQIKRKIAKELDDNLDLGCIIEIPKKMALFHATQVLDDEEYEMLKRLLNEVNTLKKLAKSYGFSSRGNPKKYQKLRKKCERVIRETKSIILQNRNDDE